MLSENPKVTELKPYKGFRIHKYQTFSNCSSFIHYEAIKEVKGNVEEYIEEAYSLKELKQKIDLLVN